jgi:hypothetical protein
MLPPWILSVARLWGVALLLSAALALAGRHWSEPLTPRADVVAALVLLPPLLLVIHLLRDWRAVETGQRGESGVGAQERR